MSVGTVELAGHIGWTLVNFVWQGALIGCATAIALLFLRNAKPQQRYVAACSGLLLCLLWPAYELVRRVAWSEPVAATFLGSGLAAPFASGAQVGGLLPWLQANLAFMVAGWAAIALTLSLRMALGLLWIGRTCAQHRSDHAWQATLAAMASRFGVERPVRLRIVDGLASPITAGWLRPVVLLPAALVTGMPPHLLEALLAHELAHVRRYDYLVNLAQNVVETLLFFHPAVWWISHRIRAERELIADDFAASKLGEPRRLALALSELEKLQFSTHHLAQAANGGDLMVRIKRLLRPEVQILNWKATIPVAGLAIALLSAGGAAMAEKPPLPAAKEPVADFRTCAKPVYPEADLRAGHTGTVTMQFLISPDGTVADSHVSKSSGHQGLDNAALQALTLCKFRPAVHEGKPIQAKTYVQYIWTLQ